MGASIAVLGLGGVGGFIGAKLAARYEPGGPVGISFLARNETLRVVRERGIRLVHMGVETVARPAAVSDSPADLGGQDFLICALKAYDIDGLAAAMRPLLREDTVIVPFMNGVEGAEKLRRAFPENTVADGCVFIVSQISAPGEILSSMEKYSYMFGIPGKVSEPLRSLEALLKGAGVNAECTENIGRIVWEKFAFISPISTLMSYVQKPFGEMIKSGDNRRDLESLLAEFCAFAAAKGADLGEDAFDKTMRKFGGMADSFTTSMQRDFASGRRGELETLTGYVLRGAEALGLSLPAYEKYYALLSRGA